MTGPPVLGDLWTSADAVFTVNTVLCAQSHDAFRHSEKAMAAARRIIGIPPVLAADRAGARPTRAAIAGTLPMPDKLRIWRTDYDSEIAGRRAALELAQTACDRKIRANAVRRLRSSSDRLLFRPARPGSGQRTSPPPLNRAVTGGWLFRVDFRPIELRRPAT